MGTTTSTIQERNQFVYYVYYVSSVNVDNYSANVDNPTPKHMQFIAKPWTNLE